MARVRRLRRLLRFAPILVDAHNVCYADPGLAARMLDDPESARQALGERVRRARERTVLFCDGGPQGETGLRYRQGLRCIYTGAEPADDALIRHLRGLGRQAVVISADQTLCGRAGALSGVPWEPPAYLRWLQDPAPDAALDSEILPDAAECALWLRAFGAEDELGD